MSCYGAREFEASFRTVRRNTVTIAEEIPDDQYGFRAAAGVRSVAEMLAHIAMATGWSMDLHGRRLDAFPVELYGRYMQETMAAERALTGKAVIVAALRDEGERFATFLGGLGDDVLAQPVSFPPPLNTSKTRLEMLLGIKEHEMHHRSQLMLVERLLGIVPHLTRQREAMMAQMSAKA
jgi:uncharacterized damage-inducible protein DinB